jgi:glutathione S-transferase
MQRMIDEDLYWVVLYSRAVMPENWHEYRQALFHLLPPIIRDIVAPVIRRHLQRELYGQGTGRHTESEVFDLGKKDLNSLSDFLGDKLFFMGEQPTILDATAFGLLVNVLCCPIKSPLKEQRNNWTISYISAIGCKGAFLRRREAQSADPQTGEHALLLSQRLVRRDRTEAFRDGPHCLRRK